MTSVNFALSDVALAGIAATSLLYFSNANDRPELHYNGMLGGDHVSFSESLWPWHYNRSVLAVKRNDGSETVFVLKEHRKDRGFTIEEVISRGSGGPADATAAQERLKQHLAAIVNKKTNDYR